MNEPLFALEPKSSQLKKNLRNLKKLNPNIIRVGDKVMIAKPTLFLRCGYPLSKEAMREEINKNFGKAIDDLIFSVESGDALIPKRHVSSDLFAETFAETHRGGKFRTQIVDALVSCRLFAKHFGGNQKTLHTKECPELQGRIFMVGRIEFVTTGTYWPSHGHISMWEDDYEPACLSDQKVHKILSIEEVDESYRSDHSHYDNNQYPMSVYNSRYPIGIITPARRLKKFEKLNDVICIEAIHVEKLPDDREYIQDQDGNFINNPHFGLPKSTRMFKITEENKQ